MSTSTPLIIELRCNESAMRTSNPTIPYTPDEIAAEAVRAQAAGASILSWHARVPETGEHDHRRVDLYLETAEKIHRETDLLLMPTLGNLVSKSIETRLAHVIEASKKPSTWIDLGPVDFGTVNIDRWDPVKRQFFPGDAVYLNTRSAIAETLNLLRKTGTYVVTVVWDVAQVRTALLFQEAGLLQRETFWVFPFSSDARPAASNAEIHALLAMIAAVPAGAQWQVLCTQGDIMTLAAWSITLGGHVAVGLGDYDYPRFKNVTNVSLLNRVTQMAETVGRPIATPAQAREILKVERRAS
ncbi:MAG: 3-keto-5-aminohexanoate cleavage protein [Thermomicrobiales bacterium]